MSHPSPPPPRHAIPRQTYTIGMWLFLAALTVGFAAVIIAYVFVRAISENRPAFGTLHLPWELWLSTALVLAGSATIQIAVQNVRRERLAAFRGWLIATGVLAILFCAVQTPAMVELMEQHRALKLYGMVFFLILVHALHVIGGIIYLAVVTANAFRGRYDHEAYTGPRHAALYWHFLDVVWLFMFATLLVFS